MVWILCLVLIVTAISLMLPFVVKAILNKALHKLDGYRGQIDRVRINLFKGRIIVRRLTIVDVARPKDENPLVMVPEIIVVFKWKQLFKKVLDLDIIVDQPDLRFIIGDPALTDPDQNFSSKPSDVPIPKDFIEKLMAFKINLDVRKGMVCYINSNRHLHVKVTEVDVRMRNFSNRTKLSETCTVASTCSLYDGYAEINLTVIPLAPTLSMDLNVEIKSLNLVLLNDLLNTYAKLDLKKGTLNLFAEVAVADNSFKGYVKPLLTALEFISAEDRSDNIFRKVWERIIAGFYNVIENNKTNQVATKIPIDGRLDDPNVRVGVAIIGMLRNAFVKALMPSLENLINVRSIWSTKRAGAQRILEG